MGYTFIPYGMFVGRMQYAPTTVRAFDRWVVRMFLGRGVLHTTLYHTQQKRTIIWGFMVYAIIPCGIFVGRMQYAPTTVRAFDRWVVRVFLGRGVLHTPLYHTQRKRTIIWGFMVYSFIPCEMVMERMQYAPTRVHVFDRWVVRVFLGRGVLHTTLYHTQRKRTIIWGFMVYAIIPCGMIVGRMQYAPTRVRVFDRWMVGMFSGRGVCDTPLDHTQQKRIIIWGVMGHLFIPCGIFMGRMQYAPTRVHVFDRWMVRVFSRRGVLHTPLYHTQQKRAIIRGFIVYPFIPCGMFVGRMQYAPTTVRAFDRWVV